MENNDQIEFKEVAVIDPVTGKKGDAVEVFRGGKRVSQLLEAARLKRALNLSVEEVEDILKHFNTIMGREPTTDELEFWRAVRDLKRSGKIRK